MRIAILVALVTIGSIGCGQVDVAIDQSKLVEPPANADAAIAATCEAFAITSPPRFWFYAADPEHCDADTFLYDDGKCWGGLQGANGILLAVPVSTKTASDTAIVHELAHWKWDDQGHANVGIWGSDPSWLGERDAGYRVGDQTIALRVAGL